MTDRHLSRYLETLSQVLASEAVADLSDPNLRNQLLLANRVLGHMIVQEAVMPELQLEARQSYAGLATGMRDFFSEHGLDPDALRRLENVCAASGAEPFEQCLRLARDVQRQLCSVNTREGRDLWKRMMRIETRYSEAIEGAFERQIRPERESDTPGETVNAKALDQERLRTFIAKAFPEEKDVRIAESCFIPGGHSKYTVSVRLSGTHSLPECIILRGDAAGRYGGTSVIDEYRLLTRLHPRGVCIATPLALEETGAVFGSPFMLMEKVSGSSIGHMFNLPPPNAAICRDAATQLARIHAVPVAVLGRITGAQSSTSDQLLSWLDESYASWQALGRASPLFETAFEWLRANVHLNEGPRTLVHGDYGLNNLLIDKNKISAILDWEFAHIGTPAYDLGYFYFQAERLSSWQEFLHAYVEAGGTVPTERQLDYCVLCAATRLGVMVCQTEAAFHSGAASGISVAASTTCYHDVSVRRIASVLDRVL